MTNLRLAEARQVFPLDLRRRAAMFEDKMRNQNRANNGNRWARVKFIIQALAQGMFFEFGKFKSGMHEELCQLKAEEQAAQES